MVIILDIISLNSYTCNFNVVGPITFYIDPFYSIVGPLALGTMKKVGRRRYNSKLDNQVIILSPKI